jgi:hypothetical protein
MNENKELVQQIKFKMTFDSFVDFMFNKPVDEIIYKQLKTKIHED